MSSNSSGLVGVTKIQRGPLREQVRAQIKQLILTNRLHPGQAIVIDRLAEELGVSHTPVREALAMLQHDGLVKMRPYGNPRVADITEADVREAWEMRALLEGWAVRKAALTLSDDDISRTDRALVRAQRDAQSSRFDSHLEADLLLHEMILLAADNHLFDRMAQLVSDQSVRIRFLVESIAQANEVLAIIDEHFGIIAALKARDPQLAHDRLTMHLRAGMERTLAAQKRMIVEEEEEEELNL